MKSWRTLTYCRPIRQYHSESILMSCCHVSVPLRSEGWLLYVVANLAGIAVTCLLVQQGASLKKYLLQFLTQCQPPPHQESNIV
jgi:hypothetical protein